MFYLGLFLSQFYFFKSGMPQVSHIILSLCVLSLLRSSIAINDLKNSIGLVFLFIYIILVNLYYSIIESEFSFNFASIFMIFNVGIYFFLITNFSKLRSLVGVLSVSILFSLFLWGLGFGRYNFGERYNAFFNDPNQYAYWVLCISCGILILNKNKFIGLLLLLCSSFLIILTFSRSALIGIIIMWIYYFTVFVKFNLNIFLKGLVAFLTLFIGFFFKKDYIFDKLSLDVYSNRVLETDIDSQAEIRGYSRLIEYPEYIFFGAGQGLDTRFNSSHEIHSTWAGIFFYYGIIGGLFFLIFLYRIFEKLQWNEKILFLAPMFYGLSTFGFRNTVFWIFLAVFYSVAFNKRKVEFCK